MSKPTPSSPGGTPCLCTALRRASRAVTRVYDEELRESGLRVTQFALLSLLGRSGEVRQSDLGSLTFLEETSLTRALRPLIANGWVSVRPGTDRREKLIAITESGRTKMEEIRPSWRKAQERMQKALPKGVWETLFTVLPDVAKVASEI
jgi:DNA-binding MarR family transcriptional regulator